MDDFARFDGIDLAAVQESVPASMSAAARNDSLTVAATCALLDRGRVVLDGSVLRRLRQARLLSQQDLADDCWRRNIRVSIATIKRAECGRAVRFRIARELARCFGIPVARILRTDPATVAGLGMDRLPGAVWSGIERLLA